MWDGADEGCAPIQLGRSKPNGFGPQSDGEEEDDVPILFDSNFEFRSPDTMDELFDNDAGLFSCPIRFSALLRPRPPICDTLQTPACECMVWTCARARAKHGYSRCWLRGLEGTRCIYGCVEVVEREGDVGGNNDLAILRPCMSLLF